MSTPDTKPNGPVRSSLAWELLMVVGLFAGCIAATLVVINGTIWLVRMW